MSRWKIIKVNKEYLMERKDENKIYSMPLLKNIGMQVVGKKGWKLTQCPVCGHKCFETPQARVLKDLEYSGMCTECMLKKRFGNKGVDHANL